MNHPKEKINVTKRVQLQRLLLEVMLMQEMIWWMQRMSTMHFIIILECKDGMVCVAEVDGSATTPIGPKVPSFT